MDVQVWEYAATDRTLTTLRRSIDGNCERWRPIVIPLYKTWTASMMQKAIRDEGFDRIKMIRDHLRKWGLSKNGKRSAAEATLAGSRSSKKHCLEHAAGESEANLRSSSTTLKGTKMSDDSDMSLVSTDGAGHTYRVYANPVDD